jgi:excisionase family DNA binding protein
MAATTPLLITSEVAARLRCSVRTVHDLTRLGLIPHRRLPGSRRCLFRIDELEAWEDGARLETVDLGAAARVVRPSARRHRERCTPTQPPGDYLSPSLTEPQGALHTRAPGLPHAAETDTTSTRVRVASQRFPKTVCTSSILVEGIESRLWIPGAARVRRHLQRAPRSALGRAVIGVYAA